MNTENSTQGFFQYNDIEPSEMRRVLYEMFDGYMQNENELAGFRFHDISRKFYIVRLLNDLIEDKVETQNH